MGKLAALEPALTEAEIAAARSRRISLHTSPALLAELEDVLAREKFAARIA